MTFSGCWGKLLRINLTNQTSSVEEIPEEIVHKFVGGAGFGIKYLYDEVPAGVDPLGEDNKLIYAVGPLTGTDMPCTSRLSITTKSPLTGCVANSLSGGHFPVELKWTGFDVVIIEGKSEKPVVVYLNDGKVTFRSAEKLWGLNTVDTQIIIKEMFNQDVRISCIGPAGENMSLMAAIINEARAAGRKGVGAVMGSKNLKAFVVKGTEKDVPVANKELFKEGIKDVLAAYKASPLAYPVFSHVGSSCAVGAAGALGCFPDNNWQNNNEVEDWEAYLGPDGLAPNQVGNNSCYKCPVSCSQVRMAKGGKYGGISTEGPEYETLYSLGSTVGVKDANAVIAADKLCDELGIDTISAGVSIGMAMELCEKGLLEDKDGLDLKFGNDDAVHTLLRNFAYREGYIGGLFCDGTKKAAERIGNGTEYYAMQVKGLELPAYDVRGLKAHGLNFATSYTGADHNRGYAFQEVFGFPIPHPVERLAYEGKGAITVFNQDYACVYDAVTSCEFPSQFIPESYFPIMAKAITGSTGFETTEADLWKMGARLTNLYRMYNVRNGFDRKDDTLPERLMKEGIKGGASAGEIVSEEGFKLMLDEYYQVRGWTENGIPTAETLTELGLEFAVCDIPK